MKLHMGSKSIPVLIYDKINQQENETNMVKKWTKPKVYFIINIFNIK